MLLLSSATRILATKRPPDVLHPYFACQNSKVSHWQSSCNRPETRLLCGRNEHRMPDGRGFLKTPQYWSTRRIARQSQRGTRVSEMDMACFRPRQKEAHKNEGCGLKPHPVSHPRYVCCKKLPGHQLAQPLLLFAGRFLFGIAVRGVA